VLKGEGEDPARSMLQVRNSHQIIHFRPPDVTGRAAFVP
jgi:hypothetical protein